MSNQKSQKKESLRGNGWSGPFEADESMVSKTGMSEGGTLVRITTQECDT